jgi:hypothetical protein
METKIEIFFRDIIRSLESLTNISQKGIAFNNLNIPNRIIYWAGLQRKCFPTLIVKTI